MITAEEEKDTIAITGNFELDYNESCKKLSIQEPPSILRIPFPLPPIPISHSVAPSIPATAVPRDSTPKTSTPDAKSEEPHATNGLAGVDEIGSGRVTTTSNPGTAPAGGTPGGDNGPQINLSSAEGVTTILANESLGAAALDGSIHHPYGLDRSNPSSYRSRYKFRPTICVEVDEDEEVYKLELRNWKVHAKLLEALSMILPSYNAINSLVLWNCGLEEPHFSVILSTVLSSNIRYLSIDQNPGIPEHLFAYLVTEESSLKSLSLRMNKIGDVGGKAIGTALKTNRVLTSLNLWGNSIGKEGVADIAEGLKFNQSLSYLSLGRNPLGDEGAALLAKSWKNRGENRRSADQRRLEQDPIVKKAKGRINTSHGRNSSASAKLKSEETLNKKETPAADTKGQKKGAPAKGAANKKGATGAAAEPQPPAQQQKRTPDNGQASSNQQRKGTAPSNANAAAAAAADDKKGGKGEKKGAATAKGSKKSKVEEMREEQEEPNPEVSTTVEPMFEHNGQWFVLGNRTLSSLNLSHADIGESGLKSLVDAVIEQEMSADNTPEGLTGIFRITVQGNLFDKDSPLHAQLSALLNTRNPFVDQDSHAEKSHERKEEDDSEEGNSVLEEEN
ncbi:Leucine-rich repeat-containing protein 71 [Phlyctochytrium planicorne]|nr:Leucine-rich repeat-containing protein 71 [Phlyctochytrium planicorne]